MYHGSGTHCGLFYETPVASIEFLHFAIQGRLLSAEPDPDKFLEMPSKLEDLEKIAISDMCRTVFENYESVGLRYAVTRTDEFLPDGKLKIDKDGSGFTCATFVKGIYATSNPIVDESTWPPASGQDLMWWGNMLKVLRANFGGKKNTRHYDAMKNCGWSRFKPEELTAAVELGPPASTYDAVQEPAKALVEKVTATCSKCS